MGGIPDLLPVLGPVEVTRDGTRIEGFTLGDDPDGRPLVPARAGDQPTELSDHLGYALSGELSGVHDSARIGSLTARSRNPVAGD